MRKLSNFVWLFVSLFVLTNQIQAQRSCGSHEYMLQQMNENPRFKENVLRIEKHTKNILASPSLKTTGTITIPVHIIVVYASTNENISNAQIQSQIDVLNLDFNKLNSDWTQTPSEFYNRVSNPDIQFTLQDIERHSDSRSSWGTNDLVKTTYPPYSPTTHLNMWICNIGGGILGYAQFPGGTPATDGVVISPQYFGSSDYTNGSFYLSAPYDKGRTVTHEVGHWVNLRHIWGDGPCGATDYVDDTPDAAEANYSCPTHPSASCNSNDMFMNYMDYVDDACMFMFSEGQKSRLRAIFEAGGARESFVNSGEVSCNIDACDGNVSLSLTLDNYPAETSWTLTNESGSTIDQGSGYSTKGQSISKNWSLSEGKYTFTIYDSYGDGICCSNGSGSYTLNDGCSTTLKSGGSYGSSEATTFCVLAGGSNIPPVANANGPYAGDAGVTINFSSAGSSDSDGTIETYSWNFGDGTSSTVQNPSHTYTINGTYVVTLTITDNGGATDSNATVATISTAGGGETAVLSTDDFESGWGAWTDGGGDCSRYTGGTYAYSGSAAIDIQDNSGVASSFYHTSSYDVQTPNYTQISVEFIFYAVGMETGEDFNVQYFNGSAWNTVANFVSGTDFNNSTFYTATVNILESSYNFPTNMKVRFQCDASSNTDDVYIDDVVVTASSGTTKNIGVKSAIPLSTLRNNAAEEISDEFSIYPNPVLDNLTIEVAIEDNAKVQIYSLTGTLIRSINLEQEVTTIDISELTSGIYFIRVITGDEVHTKQILKE